jgi:hypothetical protein
LVAVTYDVMCQGYLPALCSHFDILYLSC